jgi:cellulose synthase (UDP-forming)
MKSSHDLVRPASRSLAHSLFEPGSRRPSITPQSWHAESERVMTRGQRRQWCFFVTTWLVALAWFWTWWLQAAHVGNPALYWAFSVPMIYVTAVLPSVYLFYLYHMRRPRPANTERARASGVVGRVAVITLTVPGAESLDIVRRQLKAITKIDYEHDSWILVDKVHSPEIEQIAERCGVRYFCRHDAARWGADQVAVWNQDGPPFQAKTKAGNVNAWLDAHGSDYSQFTQLDIDHNPAPRYLDAVLGYFEAPNVAWVQAPSVYGNLDQWAARGSAEQELVLQGPLQMGFYGFCSTPFIIGSHCTYDTAAVMEIGGFQPTRAEDHLDTVLLASRGYRGVFLPEVIAQGDGPESFDTYLSQQFAWAYSMIQVLFQWTPRLLRNYSPRQALQFLFVQTWYTFWSLSMLLLFSAPAVSLCINAPVSHTTLAGFLAHSVPVGLTATAVWYWSRKWHKPNKVPLSWRGILLHVARWLIVLSALIQVIFRVTKPYMITVKGMQDARPRALPLKVVAPYIGLIVASLAACWLFLHRDLHSAAQGALFFALNGAFLFLVLMATVFGQDFRSLRARGVSALAAARLGSAAWVALGLLTGLFVVTAVYSTPLILDALGLR